MKKILSISLCLFSLHASDHYYNNTTKLPILKMPDTNLTFKMIEGVSRL